MVYIYEVILLCCLLLMIVVDGHISKEPKLLVISLDGFRWNYLQRTATPNFDRIISHGVIAKKGLKNCFITKTFPNHWTIVTGLYEESHGIVGNSMYDPVFDEVFAPWNFTQQMEPKWYDVGGEPIWYRNDKKGGERFSGIAFWPGSTATIKGYLPSRYLMYNQELPFKIRIDLIIEWFTNMRNPINLGLLYFNEPDSTAHDCGPDSPNVTKVIGEMDGFIGYLLHRLEETKLLDNLNIIVTSDHGFASTPPDRVINLDDYVSSSWYRIFESNPIGNILPNDGKFDAVYNALKDAHPNLTVYKKDDIPEEYHYKYNRRIQPILLVPDETYSLSHNHSAGRLGNHGYNNSLPDMHPFFIAMGPQFKSNFSVETFHIVDIYPLMCHILGVQTGPNNGSLDAVIMLLKTKSSSTWNVLILLINIFLLTIISLIAVVYTMKSCCLNKRSYAVAKTNSTTQYTTPPVDQCTHSLLSASDDDLA